MKTITIGRLRDLAKNKERAILNIHRRADDAVVISLVGHVEQKCDTIIFVPHNSTEDTIPIELFNAHDEKLVECTDGNSTIRLCESKPIDEHALSWDQILTEIDAKRKMKVIDHEGKEMNCLIGLFDGPVVSPGLSKKNTWLRCSPVDGSKDFKLSKLWQGCNNEFLRMADGGVACFVVHKIAEGDLVERLHEDGTTDKKTGDALRDDIFRHMFGDDR